jgi:N-acetylglutamate synthase-like GNAT family acetyltransferase
MEIITIDKSNIDNEHICCAIGNDKENTVRAETKKNWLKERFKDGLVFKRLDQRGKIFIEYIPIEKAWKPVTGKNFMMINCLWVSGQFKGKGLSTQLLNECINDSKSKKMDGVAVVSSVKTKPFLTDKKFYIKHGFEIVDSAAPYFELLFFKLNKNAKNPAFTENAKKGTCSYKEGFAFIYSNQCVFMEEYVSLLSQVSKKRNIPFKIIKLKSSSEAKEIGSPFGTLGIYYKGEFKTHELMTESKFEKLIDNII